LRPKKVLAFTKPIYIKLKLATELFVKIPISNSKKIRENIYSLTFCERQRERERERERETDKSVCLCFLLRKTPEIISSDSARNSRRLYSLSTSELVVATW